MFLVGTSLAVQWLRVCPAMQETWVRSLVRKLRLHMLQRSSACAPQLESPRAATRELTCHY